MEGSKQKVGPPAMNTSPPQNKADREHGGKQRKSSIFGGKQENKERTWSAPHFFYLKKCFVDPWRKKRVLWDSGAEKQLRWKGVGNQVQYPMNWGNQNQHPCFPTVKGKQKFVSCSGREKDKKGNLQHTSALSGPKN